MSRNTRVRRVGTRRATDIDRVFHALGDPTRRALLEALSRESVPASSLAKPLRISLTAVIQHLRVLEASRLVRTVKVGRTRTCHVDASGFAALDRWILDHRTTWTRRLDRLGELLDEPEQEP
ncbi:MAG: winged helix-turn-helix transcriptional regulator [Planctomycetes bacterium]|nr:winged helix-turn-helix transcriptional regulator [Planctomycetota bacterium]